MTLRLVKERFPAAIVAIDRVSCGAMVARNKAEGTAT